MNVYIGIYRSKTTQNSKITIPKQYKTKKKEMKKAQCSLCFPKAQQEALAPFLIFKNKKNPIRIQWISSISTFEKTSH